MLIVFIFSLLHRLQAQSTDIADVPATSTTENPSITIINQPPVITNIIIIQQPKPTCQVNYTTCPDFSCCPTFNSCCGGACCGNGSLCIQQQCIVPSPIPAPIQSDSSISSFALTLAILIPIIVMLGIGIVLLILKNRKTGSSKVPSIEKPKIVEMRQNPLPTTIGIGRPRARSILSPIAPSNAVYAEVSNHLAYSNASLVSLSSLSVSPRLLYSFEEEERVIGNSNLLFFETSKNCNIGVTNSKLPCSDSHCGVCRILTKGFDNSNPDGIKFSPVLSPDFPTSPNSVLLVCNVVLGNTLYSSIEQRRKSYADSYSFSQTKLEYTIYNPAQAIPCYLCEIRREPVAA